MKVVAVLDTMWGWCGLEKERTRHFRINPNNHSGRRLYWFLGHHDLLVTNACPELVSSAKGRGKPDRYWLRENLAELWPFDMLLVCGKVAQQTYEQRSAPHPCRIIEMPHPAARTWDRQSLDFARRLITSGKLSLHLGFKNRRLVAEKLIPF